MIISTVVPVFNSSRYLKRCIDSILDAQTSIYISNEIILVNDGSTDNSLDICLVYAKMHENIIVISQENQGLSGARNTGMSIAKGKYITFVDSDDTVEPNYFSSVYPYLNGENDVIQFGYNRLNVNGNRQTYIPLCGGGG